MRRAVLVEFISSGAKAPMGGNGSRPNIPYPESNMKRLNKHRRRRHNAIVRHVIARGLSIVCRACGQKTQVPPGDYAAGRARCPACGGQVDRVHPNGTEHRNKPDMHRVLPRRLP